jgi:hypothetical protein
MQIREIRRIMGDHKLKFEDTLEARKFKDVIGKSVMPMGAPHMASTPTLTFIPGRRAGLSYLVQRLLYFR